jgi:hypothetical protein
MPTNHGLLDCCRDIEALRRVAEDPEFGVGAFMIFPGLWRAW